MIWNWLHRHPRAVDITLVVLLVAASVLAAVRRPHPVAGALLGAVAALALLQRRQHPLAVVAATTLLALLVAALGALLLPLQLGLALYTLAAASRDQRAARLGAAASIGAITVALSLAGHYRFGDVASRVVFLVAAWLLGDSIGSRRRYVSEIEQKAERLEH